MTNWGHVLFQTTIWCAFISILLTSTVMTAGALKISDFLSTKTYDIIVSVCVVVALVCTEVFLAIIAVAAWNLGSAFMFIFMIPLLPLTVKYIRRTLKVAGGR